MGHKYTDAEFDFIKKNCNGITSYELVERFNKYFSTELTRSQIRNYMKNHNLKSGIDRKKLSVFHPKKYADEHKKFIEDNIKGIGTEELTKMFNNHFGLAAGIASIRAFIKNNNLKSGLDCSFKTDHVPFNKGIKGIWFAGSEKAWFKKGQESINRREVGSERITIDGYTEVKVQEPNKWQLKHRIVWAKNNGPIPKGYAVIFGDGDRQNTDIKNLILVSRAQLVTMNKNKLIQNNADLTRTGVIIADIYAGISKRKVK